MQSINNWTVKLFSFQKKKPVLETWPSLKHKWITWLSPSLARLYDHRNPQRHDSPQRGFPIIVPYFDYFVYGRQIGYKFINIFLDLKGLFIEDSLLRRSSRWVFHSFFSLTSLPTTQRSLWRGESIKDERKSHRLNIYVYCKHTVAPARVIIHHMRPNLTVM